MARKSTGAATAFSAALNEELKVWMTRRGETQRSLEEKTGISNSRISKTIYKSESPLNTNELEKICKALGIEPVDVVRAAQWAVASNEPHTDVLVNQRGYALAASPDRGPTSDANEEDYL